VERSRIELSGKARQANAKQKTGGEAEDEFCDYVHGRANESAHSRDFDRIECRKLRTDTEYSVRENELAIRGL
jgi:hypothetical protein